ncbi:hypothetical protein BUALT_Bualt16G0026500 [Buddleja alternifolia]|uniref:Ribosomal RNA-processing protein 7 C-terminal domain-containing protein n=1 Tax=Buddleja alternifolia TaxID=168488 RepID=A0AAV6W940_9LAMI|nr:hypothetical protein BUALT_Bualt16G0026500 [Buddleja alternifolia]
MGADDSLKRLKRKKNTKKKSEKSSKMGDSQLDRGEEMAAATQSKPEVHTSSPEGLKETDRRRSSKTERKIWTCALVGKSKKSGKTKKKSQLLANEISHDNLLEKREEDAEDEVYQMSSGDEDYSKGMKKWITQYHQSRPGLEVLQERIDNFITAHEEQEEQARAEREAQAAEGGWTVVVQHKGRKKTTDAESGVVVGSVAQAAVLDKMEKKKKKEVGIDFYRFQKREAHRNGTCQFSCNCFWSLFKNHN